MQELVHFYYYWNFILHNCLLVVINYKKFGFGHFVRDHNTSASRVVKLVTLPEKLHKAELNQSIHFPTQDNFVLYWPCCKCIFMES